VTGSAEPLPPLEPVEVAAPVEPVGELAATGASTMILVIGALLIGLGAGLLLARSGALHRIPALAPIPRSDRSI
jgi:hypothetical protein